MKEESVKLFFREGSSNKFYFVSLQKKDNGFVVNFQYGRVGNAAQVGTKTDSPVPYDKARKVFDQLILSKTSKGYTEETGGTPFSNTSLNGEEAKDTGVRPQLLNEVGEEEMKELDILANPYYCAQEKFDGRRRLLIRNSKETVGTNRKGLVVAISDSIINELKKVTEITLDCEAFDDYVMVFDILNHPTEKDVRNSSYQRRYDLLKKLFAENFKSSKVLRLVETAWHTEEKKSLFNRLKKENAEGIVFKEVNAKYTAGRPSSGGSQLKFKFCATASCIVVKEVNSGKRSVSLQVLDGKNLVDVGNVTVYPNQVIPKAGAIVEVKYLYMMRDGSLIQPVLLGIRDDVETKECNLSQMKYKQE